VLIAERTAASQPCSLRRTYGRTSTPAGRVSRSSYHTPRHAPAPHPTGV